MTADEVDEDAVCQRCGRHKADKPSTMPGDDLCGTCRDKADLEEA